MGAWYSLRSRSSAAFARERLRRLGIPLLVGLLTLVPLQVWLGRRHGGDPSAYGGFYGRFWEVRPVLDFPFVLEAAPGGLFETGHLWFLVCLLAFSLVLLPGFTWLRRPPGTWLVRRLAGLLGRPGGAFLLALPVAAVEVSLGSEVGHGGWNHASYALLFAYGYLAAADPQIGQAFQRQWRPAAALGLLLFLASGAAYTAAEGGGEPFTDMDSLSMGFRLLKSIDGWLWVVAILGFAGAGVGRRRSFPADGTRPPSRAGRVRRLGAYANDAVLAFYVLHETVIVVVAYFVLAWPIRPGAQYWLIALVTLAATLLLYDLGFRRSPVTRFLFGLKQPARPSPRTNADEPAPPFAQRRLRQARPARPVGSPRRDGERSQSTPECVDDNTALLRRTRGIERIRGHTMPWSTRFGADRPLGRAGFLSRRMPWRHTMVTWTPGLTRLVVT
jgi:Acyltransferase family